MTAVNSTLGGDSYRVGSARIPVGWRGSRVQSFPQPISIFNQALSLSTSVAIYQVLPSAKWTHDDINYMYMYLCDSGGLALKGADHMHSLASQYLRHTKQVE